MAKRFGADITRMRTAPDLKWGRIKEALEATEPPHER